MNKEITHNEEKTLLIGVDEVMSITGLTWVELWDNYKAGKFPEPVLINTNIICWRSSEISNWDEEKHLINHEITSGKYYAVWVGRKPGVYDNWPATKKQTHRYPEARQKRFHSRKLAEQAYKNGPDGYF